MHHVGRNASRLLKGPLPSLLSCTQWDMMGITFNRLHGQVVGYRFLLSQGFKMVALLFFLRDSAACDTSIAVTCDSWAADVW